MAGLGPVVEHRTEASADGEVRQAWRLEAVMVTATELNDLALAINATLESHPRLSRAEIIDIRPLAQTIVTAHFHVADRYGALILYRAPVGGGARG